MLHINCAQSIDCLHHQDTSSQSDQRLDPKDERYRHAVASLARIVALFAKVAELQAGYQSEPDDKTSVEDVEVGLGICSPSSGPNLQSLGKTESPKILVNKQFLPVSMKKLLASVKLQKRFSNPCRISLSDIRQDSDFVGRRYLLVQLEQEIKGEGAATIDIIQVDKYRTKRIFRLRLRLSQIKQGSVDRVVAATPMRAAVTYIVTSRIREGDVSFKTSQVTATRMHSPYICSQSSLTRPQ
ncbi:hypothetical protein BDZ91DRAFT_762118 [Kalaharituber pfeilii]|nr:hypothetical protein BDZ91DRAFT_762118 [Kalaharituber pfeilii]